MQTALRAGEAAGQPLRLDAFYQRVSDLAGVSPDEAEGHARAVAATLQEEVVGTPLEELFARLPQEYRGLLPEQPSAVSDGQTGKGGEGAIRARPATSCAGCSTSAS